MTITKLIGKLIRFKSNHEIYGFIIKVEPDFFRRTSNGIPNKLYAMDRFGNHGWEFLYDFNAGLEFHDGKHWSDIPETYYYNSIII